MTSKIKKNTASKGHPWRAKAGRRGGRAPRVLPRAGLDQNLAGVLEPVFAIRTEDDLGVGDTGGVRRMIDWCHRHGLNIFQTLPINETSDDNSPYNAVSSLALEPTTIAVSLRDLPDLTAADFKEAGDVGFAENIAQGVGGLHEGEAVGGGKLALLRVAFGVFPREALSARHGAGEEEFGAFATKKRALAGGLFAVSGVDRAEQGPGDVGPLAAGTAHSGGGAGVKLASLQEFEGNARPLRRNSFSFNTCNGSPSASGRRCGPTRAPKGSILMGDVPFGVGRYSADTWANPEIFDLEWSGGAPPEKTFKVDLFTEKWGQNWGIPLYNWEVLRQRNFDWWRLRVSTLCRVFHFFRIDHVLGFFRIYSFPWTPDRNAEFTPLSWEEAAAKNGGRTPGFKPFADDTEEHRAFNERQGQELLGVVLEVAGENTVIAEDLGMVPEYVPPTLLRLGIPGFRIPMFFREPDGSYSDPRQYPLLTIAQPATHDHPPLAAMWAELWAAIDAEKNAEDSRRELDRIMAFAGLKAEKPPRHLTNRILEHFARAVLESRSWMVVFQITDILGEAERFNVPGSTSTSNWSNRLPHTVEGTGERAEIAKARGDVCAAGEGEVDERGGEHSPGNVD